MKRKAYVGLLRGVNVGGKVIKMPELRKVLENAGFEGVQTYIQSGNLLFTHAAEDTAQIGRDVSRAILDGFGLDVPTLIADREYLAEIIEKNPFLTKRNEDPSRLYVTFLMDEPGADRLDALDHQKYLPEEFEKGNRALYFFSPLGYGTAKMNNNFFENKLKLVATTRNWKSVNELHRLVSVIEDQQH